MMFNINANGTKEVNSSGAPVGDPDGSLVGTLTLDNGSGSGNTGSAMFNLTFMNLATNFTGFHIHQAPVTTTGGIVVPLGDPNLYVIGTDPTSGTISGSIGSLSSTTIANIFANPSGFYLNLHNGAFTAGAVRDQLSPVPEPSTIGLAMAGLAVAGFFGRRRARLS